MIVGAPPLKRYTAFGNLFAAVDGVVHRIDRHPTMKYHPVIPMREADSRVHLKDQTNLSVGLLDVLQLRSPDMCDRYRDIASRSDAVLIDVVDEAALSRAGRLIWTVDRQLFVVGSSGVEYALIQHCRDENLLGESCPPRAPGAADRILVLSGSCCPVTQQQINTRAGTDLH